MSLNDVKFLSKDRQNHKISDQLVVILQDLIRIPSPSGCEEKVAKYLERFGKKYPAWKVERDEINNVYFVPNDCDDQELPLLMAHSDTYCKTNQALLENVEIVKKYSNAGLICDYSDRQLGYDDKCGIAIILWLIANRPNVKFRAIITVQEERCNPSDGKTIERRNGGCGIQFALENKTNFFNSQWGLLLDRAEDKETVENLKPEIKFCETRETQSNIIWKYSKTHLCNEGFLDKLEAITDYVKTPMRRGASKAKADAMNIKLCLRSLPRSLDDFKPLIYKIHTFPFERLEHRSKHSIPFRSLF